MTENKRCLDCGETIEGRVDKLFCSPYCKSSYHYRKNKDKETSFFKKVDNQLKRNRRILKQYNKAGLSTVRKNTLLHEGFNPDFFTHYWKAKNGNVYLFVYEYGFMEKTTSDKKKYILVQWQPYMNKA